MSSGTSTVKRSGSIGLRGVTLSTTDADTARTVVPNRVVRGGQPATGDGGTGVTHGPLTGGPRW
jgi:hypothetical protein